MERDHVCPPCDGSEACLLKNDAKEIHATITASTILDFVRKKPTDMVCFRCGELGHTRAQCMTFKVRMCRHMTECTRDHCTFAHTEEERRTPSQVRCIRVLKQSGSFIYIGCNATDHTYRKCPFSRNILFV
jgi:hypothetical protein